MTEARKQKLETLTLTVIKDLNQMNWLEEPVAVLKLVQKYMREVEAMVSLESYDCGSYRDVEAHLNHWLIDCVIEVRFPSPQSKHKPKTSLKQQLESSIQNYASNVEFMIA